MTLEWKHIDWESRVIKKRQLKTKTGFSWTGIPKTYRPTFGQDQIIFIFHKA
jgi:hypothetical protein